MNKRKAEELVEKFVISNQSDCALVREGTEEFENCFAVRYQSKKFLETSDPMDQLFGHGPVLVDKNTGKVWETGSAHSVEHYVEAFDACGDPSAERTDAIKITHCRNDADWANATKCVQRHGKISLAVAKCFIDSALQGNEVVISFDTAEFAAEVVKELTEFGFQAEQLWSIP